MTLTEFLLARIAEDEAVAQDGRVQPPWIEVGYPRGSYFIGHDGASGGTYLALNPARVLAECEAKRRIIGIGCGASALSSRTATDALVDVRKALALPYADHPDYDQDWRP